MISADASACVLWSLIIHFNGCGPHPDSSSSRSWPGHCCRAESGSKISRSSAGEASGQGQSYQRLALAEMMCAISGNLESKY